MSVKYPNYVNLTSLSEEQPNERTPSPPPRKKSLSPPQAPSKSISSKSTHYTSSSSPMHEIRGLFAIGKSKLFTLDQGKKSRGEAMNSPSKEVEEDRTGNQWEEKVSTIQPRPIRCN
ncbi:hypothetical protein Tco_1294499 [Tanacetum coccineum]